MRDLSALVAGFPISSESAGNTQASPESARLAGTAHGSPSILPPSPTTDNVPDTTSGTTTDYAPLISESGAADGSRPSSDPFSTRPGTSRLFKQI